MRFAGKNARMTTAFAQGRLSRVTSARTISFTSWSATAKARELYFTAEILNAEQMEKLGLVNRVIEDDKLESETMAFAKKLAAGPRVAWWHVKQNMKVAERARWPKRSTARLPGRSAPARPRTTRKRPAPSSRSARPCSRGTDGR